jgi:(R,R)-butanediol dehydrogenase/meso-butanediol dehydrogenase/diacetyl reductase
LLILVEILQSIAFSDQGETDMKAARYHGRLDIRVEDVPSPTPADDELLLAVSAVGICGTDAAEFAHGPTMFPIESAHAVTGHRGPMTPGHEFAGIVVAAGRDVRGFAEGDLVASGAGVSCGACSNCRKGRTNLCERYFTIGLNRDGALAELTTVPASACVNVEDRHLSGDVAAMAQPMSIAVHAMRRGDPQPGEHVLVIGAGGIGAFLVHAAARHGAHVSAVDLDSGRLAVAAALGAERTAQTTSASPLEAQLGELPTRPSVVYECTGHPPAAQAAVAAVERGGRVVVVGLHKPPVPLNLLSVALDEKEVVGTLAHVLAADLGLAVDLLEDGASLWPHVAPVVVPLEEVVDTGLRPMIEGGETPIKLLLDPQLDAPRPLRTAADEHGRSS